MLSFNLSSIASLRWMICFQFLRAENIVTLLVLMALPLVNFFITFHIYLLFRHSLENQFSFLWKVCSVTPNFKSDYPYEVTKYRFISILPHQAKDFELIVYNCIKRNLNYIFIPQQYGFRLSKFTITSNIIFTLFIFVCFHNNQ